MIDVAAKKRIIDLYNEGKNKTEIQKLTKISAPSIRKIIENYEIYKTEQESDRTKYNDNNISKLSEIENRIIKLEYNMETQTESKDELMEDIMNINFIINTTLNWHYGNNKPFQILRNGVRFEDTSSILEILFPQPIVNELINKIKKTGITKGIFKATVIEKQDGTIKTSITILQRNG